jgi:hypothetical protein
MLCGLRCRAYPTDALADTKATLAVLLAARTRLNA